MKFRSHHQTLITFLLKIRERENGICEKNTRMTWWRISRRVWGYARTVRGVPQSKSPRRGPFLEREQERKRDEGLLRFGKEKGELMTYLPATWDPPARDMRGLSATPLRTVREVRGRSVICTRTSSTSPLAHEPRGRSAPPRRRVRQERPDSPAHCRGQSDQPFHQLDIF
jgi:hypothetical protein